MANTFTLVANSPNRLAYLLTGDGTVVGPTFSSAQLLGDCPPGPLRRFLDTPLTPSGTNDDARAKMLTGLPVKVSTQLVATPVDTTAESNQVVTSPTTDGGAGNRPSIVCGMSDTTGQVAMLVIEYVLPQGQ